MSAPASGGQRVLVKTSVLHDDEQSLLRFREKVNLLQRIAVDRQQVGVGGATR